MQGGQHAGVRVEEVAEVVVRGVLAAEDSAFLGHLRLDEGVAHAGAHRLAALGLHQFAYGLGGDQVVDDRRARLLVQVALGDHGADGGGRNGLAQLVHDEAAVCVAVEGDAEVRALVHGELLQIHQVLRIQRIGLVVREVAVELEVEVEDLQRVLLQHGGNGQPAHAVARVHRDLQGVDVQRHQVVQVFGVAFQHVLGGIGAGLAVVGGDALDQFVRDAVQAGILPHRAGAGAAELDAVILRRVVGGGEHGARAFLHAAGVV